VQRVSKIDGGEHLCVDLLAADAAFAGLLGDTIEVRVARGPLTVISREGSIKMKQLAGRPQDVPDLARLEGFDD
jgi:hypothetical protein